MKNLLTQWETEEENQKIVDRIFVKNLLTQWETEEENRLRKVTWENKLIILVQK